MTATIETAIWLALKARVQSLPLSYPVDWPRVPFDKPQSITDGLPNPYLEVRLLPNVSQRLFIDSKAPHRRTGILQISLMYPIARTQSSVDWEAQFAQIGGAIAAHFPPDHRMHSQGVTVRVEKAPDVAQPLREDAYWRVPVSIRFDCFA